MTGKDDMTDDANDDPMHDRQVNDDAHDIARAGALLRRAMPAAAFADGFADRTMARLAASRAALPPGVLRVAAMQRSFRLLAAAAAVAIIALGVHNTLIVREENTTLVEAAIGLQPVSAETVLSYTSEVFQ